MALIQINTHEVQPGRVGEFLDNQRAMAALQERWGARRRLIRRITGDSPLAIFSVVLEFDDWDAYAKYQAQSLADPEWAERVAGYMSGTGGSDAPARMVSVGFATDVEL